MINPYNSAIKITLSNIDLLTAKLESNTNDFYTISDIELFYSLETDNNDTTVLTRNKLLPEYFTLSEAIERLKTYILANTEKREQINFVLFPVSSYIQNKIKLLHKNIEILNCHSANFENNNFGILFN